MEFFKDRRVQIVLAFLFGAGIVVVILLLEIFVAGFGQCDCPCPNDTTTTTTPSPNSLYFNVFTLRSLQTFCKTNRDSACNKEKEIPDENLAIVGLSTSLIDEEDVLTNCLSNEKFDVYQFDYETIIRLNERWAAPFAENKTQNIEFWKQEWDMYGTCTGYNMTGYFKRSLALTDKFPLDSWLFQSAIYPDNNQTYFVQNFTDALVKNNINQNEFVLTCQVVEDKQWLDEVSLCLSHNEEDSDVPVDCHFWKSNCNETLPIYFVQNYTAPVSSGSRGLTLTSFSAVTFLVVFFLYEKTCSFLLF